MKTVYVAIPNQYVNFADGIVASLRDSHAYRVSSTSLARLATIDLQQQTYSPPDDLVRFWIRERRNVDRNYWLYRFLNFAAHARQRTSRPLAAVLVGSDEEPRFAAIADVVYNGNVLETRKQVERLLGG